jgi:uncharacterized SAM-binding protein YcdF (DUF218 family)
MSVPVKASAPASAWTEVARASELGVVVTVLGAGLDVVGGSLSALLVSRREPLSPPRSGLGVSGHDLGYRRAGHPQPDVVIWRGRPEKGRAITADIAGPAQAGRRRLIRWIVAGVASALILTWLIGGYFVIVSPVTNRLEKADAIVVLGPPDADRRADYALELAERGYAPVVAISVESDRQSELKGACNGRVPSGITAMCFRADPETTQGEARQIKAYAAQYGWKRIIVVTSSYHVSRARLIVQRCFQGQVLMESPPVGHSVAEIAYQYLYQSAGYVKALTITTGC